MLTKTGILAAIAAGDIAINPFDEKQLNPNSYDLRLAPEYAVYEKRDSGGLIDAAKDNPIIRKRIGEEGLVLEPGELYLMATQEYTYSRCFVPGLEGRSSLGRLGVSVHATAGFGDVGFKGTWTLEVSVIRPVRIYRNMRFCQLFFEECSGPVNLDIDSYTGKYNGQVSPKPSQIFKERNEWN